MITRFFKWLFSLLFLKKEKSITEDLDNKIKATRDNVDSIKVDKYDNVKDAMKEWDK